jgi:hypothetical protein
MEQPRQIGVGVVTVHMNSNGVLLSRFKGLFFGDRAC